jgi:hypothetical protein
MSDPWADLGSLADHLWGVLEAREGPARFVALATAGADGAELRTVALRGADRTRWTVEMASDRRTGKVRALERDPRAEVLLWDPAREEQVRLALTIELLSADAGRWARIPPEGRANYGTDPAPGTIVPDPETVTREPRIDRFVALVGEVRRIDAVSLAHDPHRRARLWNGGGAWVAP